MAVHDGVEAKRGRDNAAYPRGYDRVHEHDHADQNEVGLGPNAGAPPHAHPRQPATPNPPKKKIIGVNITTNRGFRRGLQGGTPSLPFVECAGKV